MSRGCQAPPSPNTHREKAKGDRELGWHETGRRPYRKPPWKIRPESGKISISLAGIWGPSLREDWRNRV